MSEEGTSNEPGSKSEDYSISSNTEPELANLSATPPNLSTTPPASSSPALTSPRPTSSLSAGSADNSDQVAFNVSAALIANASLENPPTTQHIPEPEHVLLHVETEDAQHNPVRNITHILHFEHEHESQHILDALATNALNIELPEQGLQISLSRLEGYPHSWRPTRQIPSSGPSSTNATYGDSQPPSKEGSKGNNPQPPVNIEQLSLSAPSDPPSVHDAISAQSSLSHQDDPIPGPSHLSCPPDQDIEEEEETTRREEEKRKREPREYDG